LSNSNSQPKRLYGGLPDPEALNLSTNLAVLMILYVALKSAEKFMGLDLWHYGIGLPELTGIGPIRYIEKIPNFQ